MGATVLPALEDVDAATFLPSSRSVLFRRAAWQRVGGYPEWLDYCEDLVFDLALQAAGLRVRVRAAGHRLVSAARLAGGVSFGSTTCYARGDGKADLWRERHAVRYATYLGAAAWPCAAAGRGCCWWSAAWSTRAGPTHVSGRSWRGCSTPGRLRRGYAGAGHPPGRATWPRCSGYPVGIGLATARRMDLSLVILNYNTREHLRACLESLARGSTTGGARSTEVLVVDNASRDGSADMVEAEFPWVTLIRSPRNGGFAYGNNQAPGALPRATRS